MISFFRKALSSWMALGLFALILIAFVITGFGSPSGLESLSLNGDKLAQVGSASVSTAEASASVQREFDRARQERPTLTLAEFLQAGALEDQVNRLTTDLVIDGFATSEGMVISRRLIDRDLAKVSLFHGPTGKFDPARYDAVLQENKLTDADARGQFRRTLLAKMIELPSGASARMPDQIALAYTTVQLETRSGLVATIAPSQFMNGPAPTEAELKGFYQANQSRYIVPETRVVRYAMIPANRFVGKVQPSEQEVADAYKAKAAQFAQSEKRTLVQAIIKDEAAAKALAAQAASGGLAAAAKAKGSSATTLKPMDRADYAAISTAGSVADAAFKAAEGSTLVAGKSALGWHVVQVSDVTVTGGKTLDQARAELLPDLIKHKESEALLDFITTLEDAIDDGQTLDAVAKAHSLTVVETPALTASGVSPAQRDFKLAAELAPVLKEAFAADEGDEASVSTLDPKSGLSVVYQVTRVNASAPKSIAALGDQLKQDFATDRALKGAKKAANAVLAKVNKGMALPAALASEKLGGARALSGQRVDLGKGPEALPAGFGTLFDLSRGKARLSDLPGSGGYAIVWLDKIVPGTPKSNPQVATALGQQLTQQLGREYAEQFLASVQTKMGVTRNEDRIARLKRTLANPTGQ